MARISVSRAMQGEALSNFYDGNLTITSHTNNQIVLEDVNGREIVLKGKGLVFDEDEMLISGKIQGAQFEDADGKVLMTYAGANLKAPGDFSLYLDDVSTLATFLNSKKDVVRGSRDADYLISGDNDSNDSIYGKGGNDEFIAASGNNTYLGGSGFDVLDYRSIDENSEAVTQGIVLNTKRGTVINAWGDHDKIRGIEAFHGTSFVDVMRGGKGDQEFIGYEGNDFLRGGRGLDTLRYSNDFKFGGNQGIIADFSTHTVVDGFGDTDTFRTIEKIIGTKFNDSFVGDGGVNWFFGRDGVDSFDGEGGLDVVSFYSFDILNGINVDLSLNAGQVVDDGYGNTETLYGIERIQGSALGDSIKLGSSDAQSAWGELGNDTLISGEGKQYLSGGDGSDTFVFETVSGIGRKRGHHDVVTDFSRAGGDKLDMSDLGDYSFIGKHGFSGDGASELRYKSTAHTTFIFGDADGDGRADFALELTGRVKLTDQDFIL